MKPENPDRKSHWEHVYTSKAETGVSWYQDEPKQSLELIDAVAPATGGRIIDVGGGASVLVDRLLVRGFEKIVVLDLSEAALRKARARLGESAGRVGWVVADVTAIRDVGQFDVWHDRAVFHFLTEADDRRAYADLARRTLPAGGHLIISTFAEAGPKQCSNLDVCRYGADSLAGEFEGFDLVGEAPRDARHALGCSPGLLLRGLPIPGTMRSRLEFHRGNSPSSIPHASRRARSAPASDADRPSQAFVSLLGLNDVRPSRLTPRIPSSL